MQRLFTTVFSFIRRVWYNHVKQTHQRCRQRQQYENSENGQKKREAAWASNVQQSKIIKYI